MKMSLVKLLPHLLLAFRSLCVTRATLLNRCAPNTAESLVAVSCFSITTVPLLETQLASTTTSGST